MKNSKFNLLHWGWVRLKKTNARDKKRYLWLLITCLIITNSALITAALGVPTGVDGISVAWNVLAAIAIATIGYITIVLLSGAIFSFLYLPVPRLTTAGILLANSISVYVLIESDSGTLFSFITGIGYSIFLIAIGYIIKKLYHYLSLRSNILLLICLFVAAGSSYAWFQHKFPFSEKEGAPSSKVDSSASFDVSFFTYGSGTDVQREEFGNQVDEQTPTVDASDFVTRWSDKRADFWDFTPKDIPLNGRVWAPEGDGPFPVILMTHGNHTMEELSTSGYDYLGKHLASKGFIFVSVDEDFVNYSHWRGSPNDNYQLRAWILLQHLTQLQEMNETTDSRLSEKIDFNHVGLAGHSRGGQAAPMAADYQQFFDDPELLNAMNDINIEAVASLAPTDKSIDDTKAELQDTSYMVLQGAQDADISDFRGNQQFHRTMLEQSADTFKSTVYLADANHAQFNTNWGRMDLSFPKGLFLNYGTFMPAADQREITKTYMAAFFERAFLHDKSHDDLFKNYPAETSPLPDATVVTQFQDGDYTPVQQYQENEEPESKLNGFSHAEIIQPENRAEVQKGPDVLSLEWQDDANYEVNLPHRELEHADSLVLTVANTDTENTPYFDAVFEQMDGTQQQVSSKEMDAIAPVIETNFTPFSIADQSFREGKYEHSWEPIFQTIEIPLEKINTKDGPLMMDLQFGPQNGKMMIQEIGVSSK
ncbi:MAG TPA: hypothetical protein VK078_03770 [Pseudogracilibacillus sp.]|nr:hypothetical protein [Pseudogracilibacillus sp.]